MKKTILITILLCICLAGVVIASNLIVLENDGNGMFQKGKESINLINKQPYSKAYIAWYDHNLLETGWMGCHYNTSKNSNIHQHCSWETRDLDTGYLNTRFESYGKRIQEMYIQFVNVSKVRFGNTVKVQMSYYRGEGNGFACFDKDGYLFRSNVSCN